MKRWKPIIFPAVIVLVGAGGFVLYIMFGGNYFAGTAEKALFVSKGETWEQVVDSLELNGIIRSRMWFELAARITNKPPQFHVGKYEFKSGISNAQLYLDLRTGRGIVPIAVTLKEGRRALSYARTCGKLLGVDTLRFMNLVNDASFARSLNVEANNLEGYLFPDTYSFQWQTDEAEIITRLVHHTQKIFTDSLLARAAELKMTMHEVLTLASLIEGEAILDEERATISGVYHNRLQKGMKLQADPTIQFIISSPPRRILYSDLMIRSPYNTYRNPGLPPGPINNPREASIVAALYPERHNYLFFVANGRGGHWFSTNYAAHMDNVKRFRREREEQLRMQGVS